MTPNPPTLQEANKKMQKHCQHHQKVLQRFLEMLAMIRHNYAPDFDSVHLQGVQWDSLESSRVVGMGPMVDTPVLHALFARTLPPIILHVL